MKALCHCDQIRHANSKKIELNVTFVHNFHFTLLAEVVFTRMAMP